jgi:meiotic recombination protein DMC1
MALFRTDFSGRGELSERQQKVFLPSTRSKIVRLTDDPTARPGIKDHVTAVAQVLTGPQMLSKLSKLSEEFNVRLIQPNSHFVALNYVQRSQYSLRIKYNVDEASDIQIYVESNFFTADPGATMTFVAGGALKPIGGHILSHASATRMFLRKG